MKYLFFILLFPFLTVAQTITLTDADIKAFPTAEGHGRFAPSAGTKTPYFVTNLNDSGTGSLRDAVSSGNKTIIYRVGGTIELSSDITSSSDNIHIAGQTAPGDGIAIHGGAFVIQNGSDWTVRHMRFRDGDPGIGSGQDAVRLLNTVNSTSMNDFIFDHCSISWGDDENLGLGSGPEGSNRDQERFTLQNSIVSECFEGNKGILLYHGTYNFSFIRNLFAHNNERNIRSSTAESSFEMINNVVYGFYAGTQPTTQNTHDVVGNLYFDGHSTALNVVKLEACTTNCAVDIDSGAGTSYHISDNKFNGGSIPALNSRYTQGTSSGSRVLASTYTPLSSSVVLDSVLGNVGARANLSDGNDALDLHIIADVVDGSSGGFVDAESGTTGLPTLSSGTAYTDTDSDGLSDAYETANGGSATALSPTTRPATANVSNGKTVDQTGVTSYATLGYTHLDIFLADMANDWEYFETTGDPEPEPGTSLTPKSFKIGTSNIPFFYLGSTKYHL
tara:strand:+ start:5952 stop:7463 length:1512 start_codon:yes stop_codon:yes gene_type:complete